ncbi:MAG TPA: cyanophycinase, partial [Dehalococcoidia bacterium]|nr:cyanophycinase [Dehalococcoidia bacterium]
MSRNSKGTLIIIGGHEDKQGDQVILRAISDHAKRNRGGLLIITAATQYPKEVGAEYTKVFHELGVKDVNVLDIRAREDACRPEAIDKVRQASTLFFTGGDQMRITSQMGDSPVFRCMQERYDQGVLIAGTSAGAAAMSETMLIAGPGDRS